MWKQVVVALAAFEILFAAIVVLSGHQPDWVTIGAHIAFAFWLAMEAARVRLGHGPGESATFGLLSRLFLVTSFFAVTLAFYDRSTQFSFVNAALPEWLTAAGTVLFAAGVYLRHVSIRTLGKYFVTKVQITHDHQLVKEGIYARLRHPSYTGLILGFLGMTLMLQSLLATLFFLAITLPAYLYRIRVEEKALVAAFGSDYQTYRSETFAIVPFIY